MTIAQQLKIKNFPIKIKDSKGNLIYFEDSTGYWYKCEYDSNGKETYFETSNGFWTKYEYDSEGNQIYFEDSNGKIIDRRSQIELTLEEIAQRLGIPANQLKIKTL